jgi:DNA polymerase-3 subunit beta
LGVTPNEVMTCILVQVSQEWVTFAAVDGKRVAYEDLPLLSAQTTAFGTILVPRRGLSELASILPKEGAIGMSLNANKSQVIFATATFSLAVILLSGGFPNYRNVIPKTRPTRVTVKTTEFLRIARLTQVFAEGNRMAIVTMKKSQGLEPGYLSCASKVSHACGNDNSIGAIVEGIEGDTLQIAFDVTFLLDALQTITTPDVRLEIGFADAAKTPVPAGFMTPVGAPGSVHCFVPLNVNE